MSYNQKPPGSSGSGMGGGPPNGPNNIPQVAKTFAGIQQQMQNLVHGGQSALPQTSQADISAFIQNQRIQNMLKQQQQFLQFQHQMQHQQHQQQQHQHHNMVGGGGVGPGAVGGVSGVGVVAGSSGGNAGGSGEPLALTRTVGAELLTKTYQQQANGNPPTTATFNQTLQTLSALPTTFVQQLQAFQYQMQANKMHQHGAGQGQHGHGQQQSVQGVPSASPTSTVLSHQQQQQQQQQKHQNQHQHQQQQQQNALSRYLSAAAAQAAAVSGNKISSATPPPPPPLTNQMKPPNLPPNTQITPVTASNIAGGNVSAGSNTKMSSGNANVGSAKHSAPPASISLTPSKSTTPGPSVAHQQNKFTPPTNSGSKGGHMNQSQNLPKSTHGATHPTTISTTSPAKTGPNTDAAVAALKSPQSTPVQLTKQTPPVAITAAVGNKTQTSAATTTTGAITTTVTPLKSATSAPPPPTKTAVVSAAIATTTSAPVGPNATISTATLPANATPIKPSSGSAIKAVTDESSGTKFPLKSVNAEKETTKTVSNDVVTPASGSSGASLIDNTKKESEKAKENKLESAVAVTKPSELAIEVKESPDKGTADLKFDSATATSCRAESTSSPLESNMLDEKMTTSTKLKESEGYEANESEKKLSDAKKISEKNELKDSSDVKNIRPTTSTQETIKHPAVKASEEKKIPVDLKQMKNLQEDKKSESKEKVEKEKDKTLKFNNTLTKIEEVAGVSKDIQKLEADKPDKSITCVETTSAPTTIAQNIPVKTSEIHEPNIKNFFDEKNKKDTSEKGLNKKEQKSPMIPAAETGDIKTPKASSITTTDKEKCIAAKENDGSFSSNMMTENSENTVVSNTPKAPLPHSVNKTKTEDNTQDSPATALKETAVVPPAKKMGRLAKGAKNKSVGQANPTESKTIESQEDKPVASSARVKRKSKSDNSHILEATPLKPKDEDSDRKSKRHRLKTILYQSPLPELAYITKLSASEASNSPKPMPNEDRLIVFYKNEYLAVRNAEGTFYLCQAMQNVYRTSPRISIRWLSEDAKDNNVFIPDFYDHTDIECVLTTVELKRIDKGHLRLPKGERNRIESILKKAIDVEKGLVPRPELTEENPDGLDISLFKDESQIEKKSALTESSENQTISSTPGRKSRRGNSVAASSARKLNEDAATPSSSGGKKRKRKSKSAATSSSSRKSSTKKRKTILKRKKRADNTDDDDDDDSSDDYESDAEYKPSQKRSVLNAGSTSKSAPRAQRSPLAKARAASPITPTTSRPKNVPQKITSTPSTSKATRGERAAKRKSLTDVGLHEEVATSAKKQATTTSNNKSKGTLKKTKH